MLQFFYHPICLYFSYVTEPAIIICFDIVTSLYEAYCGDLIRIIASYRVVCLPERAVQRTITKGRTYALGIQASKQFQGFNEAFVRTVTLTKETNYLRHYAIGFFDLSWEKSAFLKLHLIQSTRNFFLWVTRYDISNMYNMLLSPRIFTYI